MAGLFSPLTVKMITLRNRIVLPPMADRLLLRKRALIETINDQLKNISQIQPNRHRSFTNFIVNLLAGLIAYTHQPKKPSLHVDQKQLALLAV